VVFESGALNPDGSIVGNDNDVDPLKYEPHYREITRADQVEIYEPILKDLDGKVTTGLLHAVGYLKDNRLLPHGFDKATAIQDIAVTGGAADDPGFTDKGSTVRYVVSTGGTAGPFKVEADGISRSGFAGRITWRRTRRASRSGWCGIRRLRGSRLWCWQGGGYALGSGAGFIPVPNSRPFRSTSIHRPLAV
jgi:hypothetical protein